MKPSEVKPGQLYAASFPYAYDAKKKHGLRIVDFPKPDQYGGIEVSVVWVKSGDRGVITFFSDAEWPHWTIVEDVPVK